MNIMSIVGARPQFIKAAVVSRAFSKLTNVHEIIVHTGQHYDANMSDIFFQELNIPLPKVNLNINCKTHGEMTGKMLIALEKLYLAERPDFILVYGDTNSTLAGALAAVKMHIPVAHIEAGLRSYNKSMPEEINRILVDHISNKLFVPSQNSKSNLTKEGINSELISIVGDVMYDSALYYGKKNEKMSGILNKFDLTENNYVLATCHRAENTDNPSRLESIFRGLFAVSKQIKVICPLHPRTKQIITKNSWISECPDTFTLIPPIGYLEMIALEKNAALIATDSGGIQKEAFFFNKTCVTFRYETEWIELVDSDWVHLVDPTDSKQIENTILECLNKTGQEVMPYGDGNAGHKIATELLAQ
jgi:UDP-GlcNAc3NAcA epimerase